MRDRRQTILPDERYRKFIMQASINELLVIICRRHFVTVHDIRVKGREDRLRIPKQLICYILSVKTELSMKAIGQELNIDHATVIHNRDVVETEISFNPKKRVEVEKICLAIERMVRKTDNVQLIGKVTGLSLDYCIQKFREAENMLTESGYNVINPLKIVSPLANWREAMSQCIYSLVTDANAYYLLDNWQTSRGAKIEKFVAESLGLREVVKASRLVTGIVADDPELKKQLKETGGVSQSKIALFITRQSKTPDLEPVL